MDKFLKTQTLPRWNNKEIENLNRCMTRKEIESVIKTLLIKKSTGSDGFPGEFYQTFREWLSVLLTLFQKTEEEVTLTDSFY